ncbi:MAG TPA: amylo-alpha-1,6-glucosidase [Chitinophagaceae bacterium]|nr:amylo-alpha-1,6-glucosidase [Chitinophagaceae bacterium]
MLTKNKSELLQEAQRLGNPSAAEIFSSPSEWLETNGLGGWASSSVIGCHTRRYHGLLVAATKPPAERMNLLSKLDETIIIGDDKYELSCNQYKANAIHPQGYNYLQSFSKNLFPEWSYEAGNVHLKKTIAMLHDENTTLVIYEVLKAPAAFTLELLPLIAAKGYHSLQHASTNIWWDVQFENGIFHNQPFENAPDIFISVPGSLYQHNPCWFKDFNYAVEIYRGQDFEEDLFNHGRISVVLKEGDTIGIIISTQNPAGRNAIELFEQEKQRRLAIIQPYKNETIQQLVLAADQFIVKRGEDLKTVIAGYHWFTDWGRDTMISLPGLCLSTGRFEDAKKIIAAFAEHVSMGMLPNRFQDNNEPPEYNNVDGTLWYFIAIKKYLEATGDTDFIFRKILPVLKEIIDWHFKGTRYNIHVDEDGLLYAGELGQQLTWMDARIGTWVVTPRMGKPVEIQALWYNALKIFAELLHINEQQDDAALVELSAAKAKQSFEEKFWYAEGNYLYDNIDENNISVTELRPNQLFAISLPFALIENDKAKAVLKIVEQQLYTPVGLKSLPKSDEHYIARYQGDAWHRDSSYHEGTVWSWLLGPYVDAIMKVKTKKSKVRKVIEDFAYHLNEGCIGSVSEIFDADAPHYPRGCTAQAWGVAEVLRVMIDYKLAE